MKTSRTTAILHNIQLGVNTQSFFPPLQMMVFGEAGGEGGRYGAVGESSEGGQLKHHHSEGGASVGVSQAGSHRGSSSHLVGGTTTSTSGTSRSSSSTSSASSLVDDQDLMTHDVYQRQPLLANHDPYVNCNGLVKEGSGQYYDSDVSNGVVKIPMPSPNRDEPRFPKEKMKTCVSFVFLFLTWIVTTVSLSLTHERVPNAPPLPDVTLDALTIQAWGLSVSEIMIIISMYFCVIVVVFHKHRFIIFRRVFIIMGLLYLYRAITMYVTVVPVANPNYYCSPKANVTTPLLVAKRVLQLLSGFGLSINGQHTFCGDYIYSGHTVCLVLAYLVVREYTPRRWWPLHWMFALLATIGVVMVLLARGHYTVDCIIAYYITTRLFYIYHTMANNQNLKENGPNNFFERLWWFPMFQYFERNVQGTVPRHYEWPLPWPRRWSSKNPQRTS